MTVDTDPRSDLLPLVAGALSQGCGFAALGVALWPSQALQAAAWFGGCGLVCGALIQRWRGRHRALPPRPVTDAADPQGHLQARRAAALREAVARGAASWWPQETPGALPPAAAQDARPGAAEGRAAIERARLGESPAAAGRPARDVGGVGDAAAVVAGPARTTGSTGAVSDGASAGPDGAADDGCGGPAAEPPRAAARGGLQRRWVDGRPAQRTEAPAPVAEPLAQP